jgi:dipeptidyl aminopeptidase/acylaminoacyl peptidase
MKQYRIIFAFLWGFLLVSCATQPTMPATSTLVENTATLAPQPTVTETLVPTPTATPRPTVVPYVPADGPYLAYFRKTNGKRELILMDTNGEVHKTISMPPEIANLSSPEQFNLQLLSPDGNWLVFYTGSAGNLPGQAVPEKFDLALNLMNIKTGETYLLAHLLSKDYPKNFETAAKELGQSDVTPESLQAAFIAGIKRSLAWSPNGRYLAFAGQMEGLSSDLYLYDTRYGTIKRLSSDPEELQWTSWSPDGEWIVHSSAYNMDEEINFAIYATNLNGSNIRYLATASFYGWVKDWLNPHTFFLYDAKKIWGSFGLRLVDIDTGSITKVWGGIFTNFAFDEAGKQVLIFPVSADKWPNEGNDPNFVSGTYLVDLAAKSKTLIVPADNNHAYFSIEYFGVGERTFSLVDPGPNSAIIFLTENGKLIETKFKGSGIYVSPNKNYWILQNEKVLKIFTSDDRLVQEIHHPGGSVTSYSITWRPDESGVFFIADGKIYTVGLHSKNLTLVESKLMNAFAPFYKWVGGK